MKEYAESVFDILYLLLAIIVGIYILIKSKNKLGKLMGFSTLILGLGDSFHLIPRILNFFIDSDFTSALGIGKLITSITMTIFYIFMYYIFEHNYKNESNKNIKMVIWLLAIIRIIFCFFKENNWLTNSGSVKIGIIRNIPFVILGIVIIVLYYKNRKEDKIFKNIWLYILLSFLFYMPVVVFSSTIPIVGMLMLPKTICYILIILCFKKKVTC